MILDTTITTQNPLPIHRNGNGVATKSKNGFNQYNGNLTNHSIQPRTIFILGINGFMGHHLCRRVLETTDWNIRGIDIATHRISNFISGDNRYEDRLIFRQGDIEASWNWVEAQIQECDAVLPLAAIATPLTYVKHPLRVFELDFEVNLRIIKLVAKYRKRVIFPSTSEAYGMCEDQEFDAEESNLVYGPIRRSRWIYSCSKQLLDRVIFAYGQEQDLDFTIFRPFNWIGPGLDTLDAAKPGSSRVTTQFLGHINRGENISLVDGGLQRRSFTYIDDGIDALMAIIANRNEVAKGKIYNIGHPANNCSIQELAMLMVSTAKSIPQFAAAAAHVQLISVDSAAYYGPGYQDVQYRTPKITTTMEDLGWKPIVPLEEAIRRLFTELRH